MQDQRRAHGRVIDVERLESSEPELYLHRFIRAIRSARREIGRYVYLRSGDEMAIRVAQDGSEELLDEVTVVDALVGVDSGD